MAITISGDSPNFTSASATTLTGVTTLNGSSGVLATQTALGLTQDEIKALIK